MPDIADLTIACIADDIDAISDLDALHTFRVKYLGKKGLITTALKHLGALPPEDRMTQSKKLNGFKQDLICRLKDRQHFLEREAERLLLSREAIDVTLPERSQVEGHLHIVTQTKFALLSILAELGYAYAEGPEVETEYFNFSALNMPELHPARAMQDTFYLNDQHLLRTQTSSVQIRALKDQKLPLKMVSAGRVYRCDSDQTHTPMFHQMELLHVSETCHFSELKSLLIHVFKRFFGPEIEMRFRPSYFPFTEPSGELDILWSKEEDGNPIWLEVAGFGMVHPYVLEEQGIDAEKYTGYAFGVGLDRLAMLKFGVDDLRMLFQNDFKFLGQF